MTYYHLASETIQYQRNNNGMRGIEGFGQDIEPWGKYMILDAPRELPAGWERGEVTFNNPLRIDYADGGWKQELVDRYGTTGKDLSQALLSDGYDGIITEDKYGVAEIVDIRTAQRTAASSPGTLYRGFAVPFSEAQMEDVMESYGKSSFPGKVLSYLSQGYFNRGTDWTLGKHWTTEFEVAKNFSQGGMGVPVVLIAQWDGRGEDPYEAPGHNFGGEFEVTLLPGTELQLVDILWGTTFESIGGAGRTVIAGGDLPTGLRLEHPKPNQVVAYDDDNPDAWLSRFGVGVLSWGDDGVISWVAIQDDAYKRRGIATAMLEYARTIRSDIRHSDELSESGAGWAQAVGSRTAANDLRVHLFDSEGREMWLEPDFDSNPWTYHPKVMDAVRFLADVAQEDGVYWHADHNEFIPSTITDFKVFDGSNDVTHEIKEFPQLRGYYASRTAAVDYLLQKLLDECETSETSYHDHAILQSFMTFPEEVLDTHPFAWELKKCQKEAGESEYPETDNVLVEWLIEINEKGKGHQSRTAAEPGGVLPWTPSHRGYTWITKTDGTLEAVTNDGVNRMYLSEKPWGWEWHVRDDIGIVERGNFGSAMSPDALRDRANDLLSEFDTRAERRTRGPSQGFQDDYTQAPNTLWSKRATTSQRYAERLKRKAWSNSPWAEYDFENPTYAPYGPMTLYRGFSFEANPGVAEQLMERIQSGEPIANVFEDALIESRYSAMQFGDKVGVYWSTDKDYALNLAMVDSNLDDHVGLYIQAHWGGGDHDINFGKSDRKNYWGNESEVRLLPGTEVKGEEVGIYVKGRWYTSRAGRSFTARYPGKEGRR